MTFDEMQAAVEDLVSALKAKDIKDAYLSKMNIYNDSVSISLWNAEGWDSGKDYTKHFTADTPEAAIANAQAFIAALPSTVSHTAFSRQLNQLIEQGQGDGVNAVHFDLLCDTLDAINQPQIME